jgi:hypothetical protein
MRHGAMRRVPLCLLWLRGLSYLPDVFPAPRALCRYGLPDPSPASGADGGRHPLRLHRRWQGAIPSQPSYEGGRISAMLVTQESFLLGAERWPTRQRPRHLIDRLGGVGHASKWCTTGWLP